MKFIPRKVYLYTVFMCLIEICSCQYGKFKVCLYIESGTNLIPLIRQGYNIKVLSTIDNKTNTDG